MMKNIYLFFAVIGAIVPFVFFVPFFTEHGFSLPGFMSALYANGAAGGFTSDLFISSFVFWAFMFVERKRQHAAPAPWLFIAINLTIGLSCALPAYLYRREKAQA